MDISTYQLNTVLRVYGNQLRQGRISSTQSSSGSQRAPDIVTISAGTKREAVIEKVSSDMLERITKNGPQSQEEKEVFQKLQDEYGQELLISEKNGGNFKFKAIDETGSTTVELPPETSDNLLGKLQEHIRTTVSQNMI